MYLVGCLECSGVEVETAPSRLGLARVSVVRGEGAAAGTACIDDYIRTTEPVYDYLTQYSGLRPGDLDPASSPHHLTTMKVAYLKLRYLVDAGCVFVGHGLKKDFRMINVVVPSTQVRHPPLPQLDRRLCAQDGHQILALLPRRMHCICVSVYYTLGV